MNLRERKVTDLLKEVEELKDVNEVIKEYNMMYLKEIASLRKEAKRVHEQADLLRQYREENKQIKEAYQDREDDIKSLEQLLRRVQRETSDYSTRLTIERALTITD